MRMAPTGRGGPPIRLPILPIPGRFLRYQRADGSRLRMRRGRSVCLVLPRAAAIGHGADLDRRLGLFDGGLGVAGCADLRRLDDGGRLRRERCVDSVAGGRAALRLGAAQRTRRNGQPRHRGHPRAERRTGSRDCVRRARVRRSGAPKRGRGDDHRSQHARARTRAERSPSASRTATAIAGDSGSGAR